MEIALVIVLISDLLFMFFIMLLSKKAGIDDKRVEKYINMFNELAKMLASGLLGYLAGKGGV